WLDQTQSDESDYTANGPVQRWRAELDSVKNWTANRIETVVVAGTVGGPAGTGMTQGLNLAQRLWAMSLTTIGKGDAARMARDRAYLDSVLGAPLEHTVTMANAPTSTVAKDYFMAQLAPDPHALPGVILDRSPVTCDLIMAPTNSAPAAMADNFANSPTARPHGSPTPWLTGTLFGLAAGWLVVLLARRRRGPRRLAEYASGRLSGGPVK